MDHRDNALLSCLPPGARSGGASVSGRPWYSWELFSHGDSEDSGEKAALTCLAPQQTARLEITNSGAQAAL